MATFVRKEVVTRRVNSAKPFQREIIQFQFMLLLKFIIFRAPIVWHVWMEPLVKKIVGSELICFLCGCTLTKERVRIFGNSSADIQGLIKAAVDVNVTVSSSSEIFHCTANSYRRLIHFEKNSNNLCNVKKEINKDYGNGESGVRTKRLRKETKTCLAAQMDPRPSNI